MKKVEAVVRRDKFPDVCRALENSGIGGMTAFDAKGFGHGRNGLQPKVKIEIYCDEFQIDQIVEIVRDIAKTGTSGDGKIAVLSLENIIKIRTGEEGAAAI